MCGIAGFLNLSQNGFQVDERLLDRMQQSMVHRGPDGYRHWVSSNKQLGLTHRRLSIVDLTNNGTQPMTSRDGRWVISYNGEIYNASELRRELEQLGYTYFSSTDTETILYAFDAWGVEALNRFEGMFAFALYDTVNDELYLVRDRIGIKPLYFCMQGGMVSFASEIKALWTLPWVEKKLNPQGLYHYLTYMITPAPMTLYEGVYKLPAGFYMKIDRGRTISFHEWYNPLKPAIVYDQKDLNNEQFCIDTIRTMLRRSIKQQLMSDVPYGVFLSGGIDSSLNTALMSECTDKVKTFNVSFSDGPELSEVEWARTVAKTFNTEHHEIEINEKDAFDFFTAMVYHQDEPLADCVCVPLYYVSKLLRDSGVVVVQVGEGSDELFCGYKTYGSYVDSYRSYWQPASKIVPQFARPLARLAKPLIGNNLLYQDLIDRWVSDRHFFWSGAMAFPEAFKRQLWNKTLSASYSLNDPIISKIYPEFNQAYDSYAVVDYHLKQLYRHDPKADFLKSMTYLEFKNRLPELLLMRCDKMTMATSVEGRVPFLDHHLVEFAFQIPAHLKYRNGETKYILKKACEGILPNDVIYRPKMGFAAPTKRWFKEGAYFRDYFGDLLATKKSSLQEFMNVAEIERMLAQTQQPGQDHSLYLWVIQNVLATDVL